MVVLSTQRRLLWFVRQQTPLAGSELVAIGAGLLASVKQVAAADGSAALARATDAGLIGRRSRGAPELAGLVSEFRRLFPEGVVADLDGRSDLGRLPRAVQRLVWSDAVRGAHSGKVTRSRSGMEVTSFRPGGEIRALFAAPSQSDRELRIAWRRRLDEANWSASQLVFREMARLR